MSKAYSELEKEHQALNAKHQDLILNSTPSVVVQDLQQQVDDLTAEIHRRSRECGQMRTDKIFLSSQVKKLHIQNTHLTQVTKAHANVFMAFTDKQHPSLHKADSLCNGG